MAGISLADQIKCVERELALRRRCYPNWVRIERISQAKSDHEIDAMEAVLESLLEKQREFLQE